MKLWFLKIPDDGIAYDSYDAFVLWAPDESSARLLACEQRGDNPGAFLRPAESTCVPLSLDPPAEPTVVLGSFNAG